MPIIRPTADDPLIGFREAAALEFRLLDLELTVERRGVPSSVWLRRLAKLIVRRPALRTYRREIVAYLVAVASMRATQ